MEVSVEAVVIADIHCHSVHSEVMGLLGGNFERENKVLRILTCEACESLSTGVQCEMDPGNYSIFIVNVFLFFGGGAINISSVKSPGNRISV